MNTPKPRRIEWAGPEGYIVWTDEDGTHLRAPATHHTLEQPDVERLFALWQYARAAAEADDIPAPKPPTREQLREDGLRRTDEYAAHRAIRAVKAEFTPSTIAPF